MCMLCSSLVVALNVNLEQAFDSKSNSAGNWDLSADLPISKLMKHDISTLWKHSEDFASVFLGFWVGVKPKIRQE